MWVPHVDTSGTTGHEALWRGVRVGKISIKLVLTKLSQGFEIPRDCASVNIGHEFLGRQVKDILLRIERTEGNELTTHTTEDAAHDTKDLGTSETQVLTVLDHPTGVAEDPQEENQLCTLELLMNESLSGGANLLLALVEILDLVGLSANITRNGIDDEGYFATNKKTPVVR